MDSRLVGNGDGQAVRENVSAPIVRKRMKKSRVHIEAMEARSVDAIPTGKQWQYEPKWDGFRCLLTRDAGNVAMRSKKPASDNVPPVDRRL